MDGARSVYDRRPDRPVTAMTTRCASFFATLECELLNRQRFRSQAEARIAVFEFIEGFYNPHRRHSALDYESPVNYERRWDQVA